MGLQAFVQQSKPSTEWKTMLRAKSLQSCPTLRLYGLEPSRLFCPQGSPGKHTGVGNTSSSRGSAWPRDGTLTSCTSCMGRCTLYHWASSEASANIKEMQIKTTRTRNPTSVRMDIIKKYTNNKCWQWCKEKGTFRQCWWERKLVQPLRKTVQRCLKKLQTEP